jgi:hypothetical protein
MAVLWPLDARGKGPRPLERRRDMEIVRVVLAAEGIYVESMMDIDAMGVPGPEGHPNATRGAERERKRFRTSDRRRRKAKSQKLSKKKMPTMGLELRWV